MERLARNGNVGAQYYCSDYYQKKACELQKNAASAVPGEKQLLARQSDAHWRKFEEFCQMAAGNSHHEAQLLLIEYYFQKLDTSPDKRNDFKKLLQKHVRDAKTQECTSLKYVDRLLKLSTPEALEIALVHCGDCIFPMLKNSDDGIKLAGRLENAVRENIKRLQSTGADSFALQTEFSKLQKLYPQYFIGIITGLPPVVVPKRFNTAETEKLPLKKFVSFLSNQVELSQFKEMNPRAELSYFSEKNVIWTRAAVKGSFFEERYFFKTPPQVSSDKKSASRALLARIEIVPFPDKVSTFRQTFSPLFAGGTAETLELKVKDHLWACDAFLRIPGRKVKRDGVTIRLFGAAHNVTLKPFAEKSPAFKAWQDRIKAKSNQKQLLQVETASGFQKRSAKNAVDFLKITPPRLKEAEAALLKCHGMTVKIVFELEQ